VGKIQETKPNSKVCDRGGSSSRGRYLRNLGITLACCGIAVGCTTIKKAGITSIAAGGGALAGTVLSGGVTAPIVGATTSAFVADVVTEAMDMNPTTTGHDMNCAPDNFWSLLGSLVEMGGWALILIVVAPMVLGWILPGPLERKKKN